MSCSPEELAERQRQAHLALANSELHVGVDFQAVERVRSLAAERSGEVALLFPSEAEGDPPRPDRPPGTLLVLDGTWPQARKLLRLNPALGQLPRIGLRPRRPGNYRIRREPAAHCLSTVEAVAEVLSHLEGDGGPLRPHAARLRPDGGSATGGPGHPGRAAEVEAPPGPRCPPVGPGGLPPPPGAGAGTRRGELPSLRGHGALCPGAGTPRRGAALHRERLEVFLAPRKPLGDSIPHFLEVPRERLLGGLPEDPGLSTWRAFAGERAVLGAWGTFAVDLLRALGDAPRPSVDLRQGAIRALRGQKPGGVERAASLLTGRPGTAVAQGRCGRRLAALEQVLQGLARSP